MNRRIVIIGFMGSGKTTVAQALAQRLGCEMIDLDSFITESEGRSPAGIIEEDGESAFREIETRALREVLEKTTHQVIALGGGAWTIAANRALTTAHDCLSVWLDAPFELCWQRIQSGGNTVRPLAPDRESALALYDLRRSTYKLAKLRLEVNSESTAETLASELLQRMGIESKNSSGNATREET